jgi:hypothetical protein
MPALALGWQQKHERRTGPATVFIADLRAPDLLRTVRNTYYTWLEKDGPLELSMEFDEELHRQTRATASQQARELWISHR